MDAMGIPVLACFWKIAKRNLKIPFRYNHTTYLFLNLQYDWGYPRYHMSSLWIIVGYFFLFTNPILPLLNYLFQVGLDAT